MLSGQHEAYLKKHQKDLSANTQSNATTMPEIAKKLAANDIDAVAHYLYAQGTVESN